VRVVKHIKSRRENASDNLASQRPIMSDNADNVQHDPTQLNRTSSLVGKIRAKDLGKEVSDEVVVVGCGG
jgi:hypothetical protein